jgi:AcrR family transcriptional regulator
VARPKSDDKRTAIMAAAVRVIDRQGLSAPTAVIARKAGVANGSLFTYFETKAALFNQLYLELKAEMASAATDGLPAGPDLRAQCLHVWSNWVRWAVRHPEKRRALAQLAVSDEITPATRAVGHETMAGLAALIGKARADGPMRDTPWPFVAAIMSALAEATMDFMVQDPANADRHSTTGFDAFWRMLNP